MGSKATHQMPTLSTLRPGDLFYVVREESAGVFKDYCAPRSLLPEAVLMETVMLTSAQILDLHTTPVELIPEQGAGSIIVVKLMTMQAVNGTTAYVGGWQVGGVTINAANCLMTGAFPDLDTPIPYYVIYPSNAGSNVNQSVAPGTSVRIGGDTSDPTTGDGDVLVKIYYSVINA